ncbi:hypothetical protein Hanom_Chr14g01262901 [Helianthus anomalus]
MVEVSHQRTLFKFHDGVSTYRLCPSVWQREGGTQFLASVHHNSCFLLPN